MLKDDAWVPYDYRELDVRKNFKWLYIDNYPSFGWEFIEAVKSEKGRNYVHLSFRRESKVEQKAEIMRLQKCFESCMEILYNMEISKVFAAVSGGLILGVLGAICLIISVYIMVAESSLGFLLMLPGLAGCLLAYPCYRSVKLKKEKQMESVSEEKKKELYQACKKASNIK